MEQPVQVDIGVLGAGAAGMLGALRAAKRGLKVMIFDPHYSKANNLSISGGLIPMAGSRLQAQAGIKDEPQRWLDDLRAFAPDSVNEAIAADVARRMPQVLDFLIDDCDAPMRFLADVPAPGHSAPRFHSLQPSSGHALHAWLRQALGKEAGIECVADVALQGIGREQQGFDLEYRSSSGVRRVRASHLLLAGGGFGGNAAMVAEFIPEMTGAIHSGSSTNDGSVIAMARGWGAALFGMDGYQGQGHTNPEGHTRLGMSLPSLGAVMLNRDGYRFVREDIGPSGLAAHVLAQPGQVALEVFDSDMEERLVNHSAYQEARAAGRIMEADSMHDLAAAAGVSDSQLQATMNEVASFARGEGKDPLGRQTFARVLKPPFRASWVTGSLAHTQGGIATDGDARVLDQSGNIIPRLYAAGGCAAGLSGRGGDGYLPGNGLSQSFGLAYAAVSIMAGN